MRIYINWGGGWSFDIDICNFEEEVVIRGICIMLD